MNCDTFWNTNFQKKIKNLENSKCYINDTSLKELFPDYLLNKIDTLIDKANKVEFQIALIGTIKAGKSSLINALLHGNYASTNVTPETAVLTKFTDSKSNNYYIDIKYYSKEEWSEIWNQVNLLAQNNNPDIRDCARPFLEEYNRLHAEDKKNQYLDKIEQHIICQNKKQLSALITKYTSSSSSIHYFIKEVTVGIKNSRLPERVVLCDTPGLDDVLKYRSDITKKYIKHADAILMCVVSEFLTSEQLHTIMKLFGLHRLHPERIYVIGTKIDTLTDPKNDWIKQKNQWIKYLSGKACYNSVSLARKNIVGVSSWIEHLIYEIEKKGNISKKQYFEIGSFAYSFQIDTEKILEQENKRKLRKAACIVPLMNILNNRIFKIHKNILEQSLLEEYELLQMEIINKISDILKKNNEIKKCIENGTIQLDKFLNNAKEEEEMNKKDMQKFYEISSELKKRRLSININIERELKSFLKK